jgi:gamma-carbonic anhydrase
VAIGAKAGIWFGAVVRGDSNAIRIGAQTNIQDNSVLHVDHKHPLTVGDDVTVGHRAILHGCTIENRCLVGMGATIMNGAVIGADSIVGAGALVTEGTVVPPRSLILGVPAKVKRELTEDEVASIARSATLYAEYAAWYHR